MVPCAGGSVDKSMRNILYITYDGLTDPLGQSQILAYLKRLSGKENRIVIMSFEKPELYEKEFSKINAIVKENHIEWIPLHYTKRPPVLSTLLDIRRGLKKAIALHKQYGLQIVHCRGYIPAIIGRRLKKLHQLKFIFDMRGWWADEKLESGFWEGPVYKPVYRYFKKLETLFFRDADFSVSLTRKGKEKIVSDALAPSEKVGVIPTCVDFNIFKPLDPVQRRQMREKLGIREDEKVFVYSGSIGGNYDPAILIRVFKTFQSIHPNSFLLILSKDRFDNTLAALFRENGINRIHIYNAPFTEVTDYLRAGEVGFIYYKMSFSTIGRSPTKLGEYWASGLPVIAFKGIGDLDYIIAEYPNSGVLLSENETLWKKEMEELSFPDAAVLRNFSSDYFHIDKGVKFYRQVYEHLIPSTSKKYESIES